MSLMLFFQQQPVGPSRLLSAGQVSLQVCREDLLEPLVTALASVHTSICEGDVTLIKLVWTEASAWSYDGTACRCA